MSSLQMSYREQVLSAAKTKDFLLDKCYRTTEWDSYLFPRCQTFKFMYRMALEESIDDHESFEFIMSV